MLIFQSPLLATPTRIETGRGQLERVRFIWLPDDEGGAREGGGERVDGARR